MNDRIHIIPTNDLREHRTDNGIPCWCHPVEDEDGLIVHNAMDKREQFETGIRKPS
jgi:hypothetical protein